MSTSNTHQQSLADAGSETRPLMLERGPYEFKESTPSETEPPRMQKEEDLKGDDFKHYEAKIEAMNFILISIPNDIYNSVDACTTSQAMWQRVERLMRGTVQNKNEMASNLLRLLSTESSYTIIFDEPNGDVNSGSVEYDNNVQESYALEKLSRNAYKKADKQQIIAKKVQQQNTVLTKQLESYKEKVWVFEMNKGNNTTYSNEYIKADRKAKRFEQESQSLFIHDRDIICDLEQQRDELELSVVELKRQNVELQKTQSILKCKISENEDKYHDIVLDLEERAKKNEDVVLKIGNSLQGMFMHGLKPMSFYDSKVKHGLGYTNSYTRKKAISHNLKLYDASCLHNSKIHVNVRDTEDILDDATTSQVKMKQNSQDPIAIEKKQNVWTIDYKKLNALYKDFVPQKEFSTKQKYFSSSFISFENSSNASSPSSSSETKPTVAPMPILSHERVKNNVQDEIEKIQKDSIEIQEGKQKRINILKNDVQRCQKQSLDFELQLQHEKERQQYESSLKNVCETYWISKMEKLKSENVSLEFQVQSLIKERENVKTEYQKLFDSIKKTRTQTQGEINELIEHVNQKTHAYAKVRAQNQDLLITISELKAKLKKVDKGNGYVKK
ncbi:hypothetical protein Tco_1178084 [Tanacetum coccineum]